MKNWVPFPLVLSAVVAGSVVTSVAHAQPPPPPPRGREVPPPPPGRPPPPNERPAPPGDYGARLAQINAQRLAQRNIDRRNEAAWNAARSQRELAHQQQLQGVWGADFLARPECHAELALDAQRNAELNRIIDIAQDTHNAAMLAHAQAIQARELARHVRVMTALRAQLGFR